MRGNRQNGRVVSTYEKRFTVHAWEIDGAGRVNPRLLNSYLQNAAIHHAIELGLGSDPSSRRRTETERGQGQRVAPTTLYPKAPTTLYPKELTARRRREAGRSRSRLNPGGYSDRVLGRGKLGESLTWMLSRMRIEMERWPHWHDEVVVKTWPSDIERIFAIRDFEMCDAAGVPFGSATSAWLVVDLDNRRPMRLPESVKALRPDGTVRSLQGGFEAVPEVESPEGSEEYVVRWNNCDFNRHLGAQHYVGWALELVPDEVLSTSWLRTLDIEYRAEARPGDRVVSEWEGRGEGEFTHRLRHAEDGRDLARMRSVWSPA